MYLGVALLGYMHSTKDKINSDPLLAILTWLQVARVAAIGLGKSVESRLKKKTSSQGLLSRFE